MSADTPAGNPPADEPRADGPLADDPRADDTAERLELALAELEVLGRYLNDASATIDRLRLRLAELERREARSLRGRSRRAVDRLLGVPAPVSPAAEPPPLPPSVSTPATPSGEPPTR